MRRIPRAQIEDPLIAVAVGASVLGAHAILRLLANRRQAGTLYEIVQVAVVGAHVQHGVPNL